MKELELKYGCNRTRNRQRSQSMMEETFQSRFSAEDRDISTSWTHLTDGSWYPS